MVEDTIDKIASVWLTSREALYKYLYTIQYKYNDPTKRV